MRVSVSARTVLCSPALLALLFLVGTGAAGCTAQQSPQSEPVESQEAASEDTAAGEAAEESDGGDESFDGGDDDAKGPKESEQVPPAADAAAPQPAVPQDAPASAPVVPPPKPSGGIISSGVKPIDDAECRKIVDFRKRKECYARLLQKQSQKAQGSATP